MPGLFDFGGIVQQVDGERKGKHGDGIEPGQFRVGLPGVVVTDIGKLFLAEPDPFSGNRATAQGLKSGQGAAFT